MSLWFNKSVKLVTFLFPTWLWVPLLEWKMFILHECRISYKFTDGVLLSELLFFFPMFFYRCCLLYFHVVNLKKINCYPWYALEKYMRVLYAFFCIAVSDNVRSTSSQFYCYTNTHRVLCREQDILTLQKLFAPIPFLVFVTVCIVLNVMVTVILNVLNVMVTVILNTYLCYIQSNLSFSVCSFVSRN
jgi:hypothetical protein